MKLTSENGQNQTWHHNDIIMRVNTSGDIVIIKNDNGTHELVKRVPYTVQNLKMIVDFYNGELDESKFQPGKKSKTHHINNEAWAMMENWDSITIELIDPETAYICEGEDLPIYRQYKGNGGKFGQTKSQPLPSGTRWLVEPYNEGVLLHLDSEITLDTLFESSEGPAIHIYQGAFDASETK